MHVELSNTENKIRRKLALILQPPATARLGHMVGSMNMYGHHGHGLPDHRVHLDANHMYHEPMYHNGHNGLAPGMGGQHGAHGGHELLGKRAFDSLSSDEDEMASQGRRDYGSRSSSIDSVTDYASSVSGSVSSRSERETNSEDEFADHHHSYNQQYQTSSYSHHTDESRASPQPLLPLDHSYPFSYRSEHGFCSSSELDEGDLERARMLLLFMHRPVSDDQRSQMREVSSRANPPPLPPPSPHTRIPHARPITPHLLFSPTPPQMMETEEHYSSKMKLEDIEEASADEHGSPVSITDMPTLTAVSA